MANFSMDMDVNSMYPGMIRLMDDDRVEEFKLKVLKNRYSGAASGDQPLYVWREPQIKNHFDEELFTI